MTIRLLLAVSVCLGVSGCAATTAGTATPAAPLPAPTAQTLSSLLLSAPEAGAALGGESMVVSHEVEQPWDDGPHLAAAGADPGRSCLAIVGAAQRGVYQDTGWTALRGQVLREPPTARWSHFATQAVVLFPSAPAAAEFFTRSQADWARCADRELSYTQQPMPDQVWSVGPASTGPDLLTVSRTQRGPQRWSCQRALGVRGNVAVDVEACDAAGPTTAAAAIASAIGSRLPAA